jgi:hypothetical protein
LIKIISFYLLRGKAYSLKRFEPPLIVSPFCLNPDHPKPFPEDDSIFGQPEARDVD